MAATIDEVITKLDAVLEDSLRDESTLGYFPALYRRVTVSVKDAIARGDFENSERMEELDVVFANRYLDAFSGFQEKSPITDSWKIAFEQSTNNSLTTLQHLLLGMNAHISLDLGIAAAAVSSSEDPLSLKNDFFTINRILESLIDDTQARLTRIFGPLGLTDKLLGSIDESLSIFSISYARDKAWSQTLELMLSNPTDRERLIEQRDLSVANFANCLIKPSKLWIRLILTFVRLLERGDIPERIRILKNDL